MVLSTPDIPQPRDVRYAWDVNPVCNFTTMPVCPPCNFTLVNDADIENLNQDRDDRLNSTKTTHTSCPHSLSTYSGYGFSKTSQALRWIRAYFNLWKM